MRNGSDGGSCDRFLVYAASTRLYDGMLGILYCLYYFVIPNLLKSCVMTNHRVALEFAFSMPVSSRSVFVMQLIFRIGIRYKLRAISSSNGCLCDLDKQLGHAGSTRWGGNLPPEWPMWCWPSTSSATGCGTPWTRSSVGRSLTLRRLSEFV